mmetsp:Transcript_75693/g.67900  ORF Transcript_75693/g.67900 Transcript_75693/m.67900 type:complete len:149 (-) Transcript_75693:145-591(-)
MNPLLVVIIGLLSLNYAQKAKDCFYYVNKKIEYTLTDLAKPATETGFYEFFKGDYDQNGTVSGVAEWWTSDGSKTANGTYSMVEAQDDEECYLILEFGGSDGKVECMTFSPTLNHQAFVGCYVMSTQCVPICKTHAKDVWIAATEPYA